jgi:YgiT-type zinc finger domain-containing protein
VEKDFCEYCNADLPDEERLFTVYRQRRGQHFIFEPVLSRVCQKCGERYFSDGAVSEMEREMQNLKPANNFVNVPVIELQHVG